MIDIHTHILPRLDDGSAGVSESLRMLGAMKRQGVQAVAATPHFEAHREAVDSFLERRAKSFEELSEVLTEDMPEIRLGAEVLYYEGIGRMTGLERLCIEGTGLLLLEMPLTEWSSYTLRETVNLARSGAVRVVIAHFERCISAQKRGTLDYLLENDLLIQSNASYFLERRTSRKALSLLKKNKIHFLGSDCHNMKERPPCLGAAYNLIGKRLGEHFTDEMQSFAYNMFSGEERQYIYKNL
ncbi:MAG: CpsB/CapC family capsule biosynthesis tyrosine phosphatase [Acutalibacteraceae bacterium]